MKDMRDFVAVCEEKGLLKRITAEVDWNLELSHIAKLNEEAQGPALLFENIKVDISDRGKFFHPTGTLPRCGSAILSDSLSGAILKSKRELQVQKLPCVQ